MSAKNEREQVVVTYSTSTSLLV